MSSSKLFLRQVARRCHWEKLIFYWNVIDPVTAPDRPDPTCGDSRPTNFPLLLTESNIKASCLQVRPSPAPSSTPWTTHSPSCTFISLSRANDRPPAPVFRNVCVCVGGFQPQSPSPESLFSVPQPLGESELEHDKMCRALSREQ